MRSVAPTRAHCALSDNDSGLLLQYAILICAAGYSDRSLICLVDLLTEKMIPAASEELETMMVEEGTPNPGGEQLVEELRWVHGIIRDNLATIAAIVRELENGAPGEQIQA